MFGDLIVLLRPPRAEFGFVFQESIEEITPVRTRRNSAVFVLGCHRSGTALLYDSLLSAGGFPLYRHAPYVHTTLLPLCGNPSIRRNREKLFKLWVRSKPFRRTGFGADDLRSTILERCRSGGDFLEITMGEMARRAGVGRWVADDCDNVMHMPTIKREIPDALFVHVVRDGRDAAVSMLKQHPVPPKLWPRRRPLLAWALLWQWTVRKGRNFGKRCPTDYIEVRYEELVREPERTFATLGKFLDHDLDYARIQSAAIGRVLKPNTVWKEETSAGFNPIGRWKSKLSQSEISDVEALIGDCLEEFRYPLSAERKGPDGFDPRLEFMGRFFPWFFETKLFLQSKTVIGRLGDGARLELTDAV
jgi:hypothetical protein